jgi:hypothetical protein
MTPRHTMSRLIRTNGALLAAATLTLTACAADDALRPRDAQPAGVHLSVDATGALASLGDTAIVRMQVLDARGAVMRDAHPRWSLSADGIVVADAEGVFRAVGNGRVTIVASIDPGTTGVRPSGYFAERVADSVVIEVRQKAARLTLAPVDTAFGALGTHRQLGVHVTDARGNAMLGGPPPLTWRSADARVVQVDGAGVVRSVGEGTSQVTVQVGDLVGAATFTVQPRRPHTSCMVFAQRRQTRQSCVTVDFTLHEREDGR